MSQINRIFKNMSWLLVSQIIASICGFVWTILIARYLGVANYGVLGFAISFTGFFKILADFGLSTHIIRNISTDNSSAPKYLGNAIPLKCILGIITFIAALFVLILLKTNELTITITLLFILELIMGTLIGLFVGSFQAVEEGKYPAISTILLNVILLIFILISIFVDWGLFGVTLSYILANFITLIFLYYVLNKHLVKPKFEFDKPFCKKILRLSLPFAIGSILYTIYYSIDVIMLTELVGDYATGIYNATYKLISVLTFFYSVYTAVFFPVMSKFFKNDKKLLTISFDKSVKYLMLIMIPLALSTMIYSADIIQLIYGNEYSQSAAALNILIWTVCLLFVNGACNTFLNASHHEITVTKIYAIAALFNVVLNFIMIPYFSYIGAAITTVLSDLLIFILQLYVMYRTGYEINKHLCFDLGKIFLSTGILGIALFFLKLNMWIALPVGIIIYLVITYIFKLFDDDDMFIIKEALGKN